MLRVPKCASVALAVVALTMAGCGLLATRDDDPGGPPGAVISDAGPGEFGGGGEGSDSGADFVLDEGVTDGVDLGVLLTEDPNAPNDARVCSDGLDNDADGIVDCDEPACATTGSCCIGSSLPGCCPALDFRSVDFSACGELETCLGGLDETFGGRSPYVAGAGLRLDGLDGDHGLALGAPIDLRASRIGIAADVASPSTSCDGCLDAVAFGLGPAPEGDGPVRADLAVVVHRSAEEVRVVVQGDVVRRFALPAGEDATFRLLMSPDGAAQVFRDGLRIAGVRVRPSADRRVLVYGRGLDTGDDALGVRRITVNRGGCDIPEVLTRSAAPRLPFDGPAWGSLQPSSPSVLAEGDELLMAFAAGGDIHLARRDPNGRWALAGSGELDLPAVETGALGGAASGGLDHPALTREGDRYVVYFTARDARSRPALGRALGGDGFTETFAEEGTGLLDVSGPTVPLEAPTPLSSSVLAARAELPDGASALLLLARSGDGLTYRGGSLASAIVVRARPNDLAAFDRDEVADPELVQGADGFFRLYYAGRRGTSWSLGLYVGDRLDALRPYGALLEGSGAGYDAFGARSPTFALTPSGATLFYTALDGVEARIGEAVAP